ncbi:MAG: FecR family protein [Bacteroidales bacterium]
MKEKEPVERIIVAITDFLENRLSPAQAEDLIKWLEENDENKLFFKDVYKLWNISGAMDQSRSDTRSAWLRLKEAINEKDYRPIKQKSISVNISVLLSIAAGFLLIILTGTVFLFFGNIGLRNRSYYETVAPKGSRSVITLTDGSIVWLNSDTRIKYDAGFGSKTRELTLEGEAYFSVTRNEKLPFTVKTSDIVITALGTAFNVKAYKDEDIIETTLEQGILSIDYNINKEKFEKSSTVLLKPHQKAVFSKSLQREHHDSETPTKNIVPVSNTKNIVKQSLIHVDTLVDTKLATSWKDSRWIFKSEKLKNLAPIIERRYNVKITFGDTLLINYRYTGTLLEESLEQVLNAITLSSPLKYVISDNEVYFYEDLNKRLRYDKSINLY